MKFVQILAVLSLILALSYTAGTPLNSNNYKENVQATPQIWLVEYFSSMCGSCKEFGPTFTKLAQHFEGRVKIGRVDIDTKEGMKLANEQDALSEGIPAVHLVKAASGQKNVLMAGDLKSFTKLKGEIENLLKGSTQDAQGFHQKSDL